MRRVRRPGEVHYRWIHNYGLEPEIFLYACQVYSTLGKDLLAAGAAIGKCIEFLLQEEIPHTMLFSQGRAFLLPRQPLIKPPFAAVIGFPEVSGEVGIYSAMSS